MELAAAENGGKVLVIVSIANNDITKGAAENGGKVLIIVSIANNGRELVAAENGGKVLVIVSIANNHCTARQIIFDNQPCQAIGNDVVESDPGLGKCSILGGNCRVR